MEKELLLPMTEDAVTATTTASTAPFALAGVDHDIIERGGGRGDSAGGGGGRGGNGRVPVATSADLFHKTNMYTLTEAQDRDGDSMYPPTPSLLSTKKNGEDESGDDDFTIAEALEVIGIGPFHYRLMVVVGLISIAGGLGSTGFALFPPLARCHLSLDSVHEAILTSSGFLGAACGGVGMGYLATRFGRRTELLILIVWTSYFGFLSAVSPNYYWLLLMRFLVGIGHGGTGQRLSILFEYIPARYRTLGAGVLTFCWNVGNFLEAVCIKVLIPTGLAWRYILATDAAIFMLCLAFQRWLPESPYFLLNVRKNRAGALTNLRRAARQNGRVLPSGRLVTEEERKDSNGSTNSPAHVFLPLSRDKRIAASVSPSPLDLIISPSRPVTSSRSKDSSILGLFRPFIMLKTTVILGIAWTMLSVAVVGCAILTEEVFQEKDSNHGQCVDHFTVMHENKCDELSSKDYTPIMIIFASEFPALFVTYFTANRLGRRLALGLSYIFSGLFFGLLIICPMPIGWTTFFLGGTRMFVTTAFSLMIVYTPEVYPTYVRGLAVGLSRAVYRMGSAAVPFLSQVLLRESVYASKGLHAAICVATGILLLFLPIETRNRHLDED